MAKFGTDWEALKQQYVTTDLSLNDLVKLHSLSRSNVFAHAKDGKWAEERNQFRTEMNSRSYAHIAEKAVEDRVSLYEATREAADYLVASILKVAKDPEGIFRHVVQMERQDGKYREKWAEGRVLDTINSKAAQELSKAITNLASISRTLDGILDAGEKAKLDIEREKLELSKRQTGMSDDIEQESGIALMPGVDESLLDSAIPDPGDTEAVDEQ